MSVTMLDLNGDQTTYNPEPPPPLRPMWVGFVLAFVCLAAEIAVVGAAAADSSDSSSGSGALVNVVGFVCWIYWLSCVHRFHRILNQIAPYVGGQSTYPITPGRAVGYHFIPFYNFYWVFKWPLEISRFVRGQSPVSMISGGVLGLFLLLGLILARLEGFLGFCCLFSIGLYISSRLRRVVAEHERVRTAAETFS